MNKLKDFVRQDFSDKRHDSLEREDYTWLQREFEKEDSFHPAQFNYVLLHANALIEYIEEQRKHRLVFSGIGEPKPGQQEVRLNEKQTFPYIIC